VEELAVVVGQELGAHPDRGLHDEELNDRIVASLRDAGELAEDEELRYSRTFAQFAYRSSDGTWACAAVREAGDTVDATTGPCPGEIADAD
jgi:hypothetical protein